MRTNHEGEIFIEEGEIFIGVYIMYFMLLMTHKKNHKLKKNKKKNTNTKITKKRNIPIIIWMVTLIKHSTTNKTNSNDN